MALQGYSFRLRFQGSVSRGTKVISCLISLKHYVRNLLVVPSRTQGGLKAACQKTGVDNKQEKQGEVKGDYGEARHNVED